MVWLIVVVAIVVLALATWAGTGRLGQMPEAVNDRPKGRIPSGLVDEEFLEELQIPIARVGYEPVQVDELLDHYVATGSAPEDIRFDTTRRGYDMQLVDEVLERIEASGTGEPADTDLSG